MNIQEFISALFEVRIVGHIAHLQTKSFAKHKALDELYTGIVDLTDSYVETYQGLFGIVENYPSFKLTEGEDMVPYLSAKRVEFRKYRESLKQTELQQKVDDIIEFLDSIIYRLKFLS